MEKLIIAIGHEYQFDPELGDKVREVVEHSLRIIRRIKEEKVREMRDMSDDQKLRQNAYKFVTEALRVTQPTAVKVLRLILENPGLVSWAKSFKSNAGARSSNYTIMPKGQRLP